MLNPKHIEAFASVVRTGSATAAAETMNTSQPSISRMIAALSSQTGITLFEKSAQRLKITQEGQLFYDEVTRFFDGLDRLETRVGEIRNMAKSEMRVASILATSIEVAPRALTKLRLTHPKLKTICNVRSHARVLDMVATGRVDIGLCNEVKFPDSVVPHATWSFECLVALHEENPLAKESVITLEDLETTSFVSLGEYFNTSFAANPRVAERLNSAGMNATNLSLPALWQVQESRGAAVIDPFTASFARRQGLIVRPFAEVVSYPVSLVQTAAVPSPSASMSMIKLLKDEVTNIIAKVMELQQVASR